MSTPIPAEWKYAGAAVASIDSLILSSTALPMRAFSLFRDSSSKKFRFMGSPSGSGCVEASTVSRGGLPTQMPISTAPRPIAALADALASRRNRPSHQLYTAQCGFVNANPCSLRAVATSTALPAGLRAGGHFSVRFHAAHCLGLA